ncbi:hypothetical protein V7O62_10360 [Methanolobus sp. ZRKC2]|uniref:hypothetical protein n=1 Tax=unclassified Methanolobus TaxID=2629569 RepID=UPI00324A71C6
MDITIFHIGALFFASITIFNMYSARKYKESYLPAIIGIMMFFSLLLFLILPWQYGYAALLLTMIFSVANYRKSYSINKKKMMRLMENSQSAKPSKLTGLLTGWELIYHLNRKYDPSKASLINSILMWFLGILLIIVFNHIWPDVFSNIHYMAFIMTVIMLGYYWQNKKLLESLDTNDFQQVKKSR